MKKIIGENNRREKWRKGPEMRSVRPWNELMMTSAVGQKEIAGRRCGRRGRRSQSKSQLQVEAKAFLLFCLASVFFKQAKAGDGEGDGWLPATTTRLISKNDRTRTGEHRWKSPHAASPAMASFPCRFLNCWPKFLGKNDRGFSSETTKEQTTEQTIWNFLRARDGWQNGRSSPETGHQSRPLTSSGIHHHDGSWCWFKLRLAPTRPSLAVSLPFFSIFDFNFILFLGGFNHSSSICLFIHLFFLLNVSFIQPAESQKRNDFSFCRQKRQINENVREFIHCVINISFPWWRIYMQILLLRRPDAFVLEICIDFTTFYPENWRLSFYPWFNESCIFSNVNDAFTCSMK